MRPTRWALAVILVAGCSSSSKSVSSSASPPLSPPTTTSGSSTTLPLQVLTEATRSATVSVGHTFEIQLPQGLQAGSWSYTQKSGPLKFTKGGSDVLGPKNGIQTFDFEAESRGTEDLSFTYLDGTPRGPNSVTFSITVR
jgi:hypothetical protein